MVNFSKILIVTLISFVVLTAAAMAEAAGFVIGFPEDDMVNEWRAAQMNEIREELTRYPNIKFLMADAGGSVDKNILDIERMTQEGVQLLFLGPRDPDMLSLILPGLRKQGIRIVLLSGKIRGEDYDTFISPDDFKIGYDAAVLLGEKLDGVGRILLLEGVETTSTSMQRKAGFIAGLHNFPIVKVISRIANFSRVEAIQVVEKALEEGIQFEAVFAFNDAMAAGARMVFKNRGINPASIPTVGIDFLPETKLAIMNGEQFASFTYPTCGKVAVAAALDILHGKKVNRYIPVPYQLVTRDNVNEVMAIF